MEQEKVDKYVVFEEVQAFNLLERYLYQGFTAEEKAREAGNYIIELAEKIKKARRTGPYIVFGLRKFDIDSQNFAR